MSLYSIEQGKFQYNDSLLLDAISFSIHPQDRIILRGPSGIGKSTLLQLIFGMKKWQAGAEIRNGKVHYQPQQDLLLPWKSLWENLEFTLGDRTDIEWYLQKVELIHAIEKRPFELSQGMKQRVTFLRTLLSHAEVLLFDEPFANLDHGLRNKLSTLLEEEQRKQKFAALIVTHTAAKEESFSGMNWTLEKGKLSC